LAATGSSQWHRRRQDHPDPAVLFSHPCLPCLDCPPCIEREVAKRDLCSGMSHSLSRAWTWAGLRRPMCRQRWRSGRAPRRPPRERDGRRSSPSLVARGVTFAHKRASSVRMLTTA